MPVQNFVMKTKKPLLDYNLGSLNSSKIADINTREIPGQYYSMPSAVGKKGEFFCSAGVNKTVS